jgi:hypothetical protein
MDLFWSDLSGPGFTSATRWSFGIVAIQLTTGVIKITMSWIQFSAIEVIAHNRVYVCNRGDTILRHGGLHTDF